MAPAYAGVTWDDAETEEGVVVPSGDAVQPLQYVPVGGWSPRGGEGAAAEAGGRGANTFALHSARTLYDDGVLLRNGLSLHKLAPGPFAALTERDAGRLGVSEGDTVSVNGVDLPVRIDESLTDGVVYVPFNQPGAAPVGDVPEVTIRVGGET